MKLKTDQFKNLAKNLMLGGHTYGEHNLMNPAREWYFGVGASLIAVAVGGYFAVSTFVAYQNVSFYEVVTPTNSVVYNEGVVKEALRELTKRQERMTTFESALRAGGTIDDALVMPSNATTTVETGAIATTTTTIKVLETAAVPVNGGTQGLVEEGRESDDTIPQLAF